MQRKQGFILMCFLCISLALQAQPPHGFKWNKAGDGYYAAEAGNIVLYQLPDQSKSVLVSKEMLIPKNETEPLSIRNFFFSADNTKLLIYTNSKKVWRYDTRGDYWVLDLKSHQLKQIGKSRPASSLMFAKFSPDGSKVAYVSEYNLYVDDLASGVSTRLTNGGNRKLINGTFDWAYEEEFACRDGFRWSPDSKKIAYWQIDASRVKSYLMLNTTDSIYPRAIPVEYPSAGEAPSPFKIGVVSLSDKQTRWLQIPTDPVLQSYLPRMEWADNSQELIMQHLNRKQNQSDILVGNVQTGQTHTIYSEKDPAFIDILPNWDADYEYGGWDWLEGGKEFIWASEKDGWRHLFRVSRDGKKETLITKGNFDVMDICAIDEPSGYVYFYASPDNATQKYLYRTRLDGSTAAERLSPMNQTGTHNYAVSPTGKYAQHSFSNYYTPPVREWVSLPDHVSLSGDLVNKAVAKSNPANSHLEFFKVKTEEGVEMDGWMDAETRQF